MLSKKRRNDGPKGVKSIVTYLIAVSARAMLSIYARRWDVELTSKALKSGLYVGPLQGTKERSGWDVRLGGPWWRLSCWCAGRDMRMH